MIIPSFINEIINHGALGATIGIIFFCYIQEDAGLILSATLASTGVVPPFYAWAGAFFGICTGDLTIYLIARILRKPMGNIQFNSDAAITNKELFMCRFVPGLRTVAYAWCGINRMPIWRFGQVIFWSGIVWTGTVFSLIYWVGVQLGDLPIYWKLLPVVLVIGLILWWRRHWHPAFLNKKTDEDVQKTINDNTDIILPPHEQNLAKNETKE
ncbi:DedA family protein [Aquirhabdus sp.]|uniref:DedA family protein n=1 Tax=Aquirhabdus sp. TaxID=2824160 RepID=UPI00396CC0C3